MDKLRLGTIGTSQITHNFIEAAIATEHYKLELVYSRHKEKGELFVNSYGHIPVETNLLNFIGNKNLDVIYIASPNSLHFEQAILALRSGKHVIVEKPATTKVAEWDKMLSVADENDVFIIEAAKHMFSPNLNKLKLEIEKLGVINGATLPYIRYSSRYDNVLNGEEPNIFSLNYAGGALMDLGVYPIYTAVALFGKPNEVYYHPRKIKTGVDGIGTAILSYESFDVTILIGKIATSSYETEIYGENKTLIIDHVSDLNKASLLDVRTFKKYEIELEKQHENQMYYEADVIAKMISDPHSEFTVFRYQELSNMARLVSEILYEMRMQAGILFPNDNYSI